jgi:anti-sigma factor RsiW
MAHSKADRTELEQLLRQLRDEPATAQGVRSCVLGMRLSFLPSYRIRRGF